jgi:hypothetical protein
VRRYARLLRTFTTMAMLFLAATAAFAQEQPQEPEEVPYSETIVVVRYTIDVRVTDSYGKAIEGLKAEDFSVKIGGKAAHVEGATWMPQGREAKVPDPPIDEWTALEALPEDEETGEETSEPEPRSIVIFIQTDFSRVPQRVLGQMKFNYLADEIVKMLAPDDRVALLSHDSQLKFRRDFTFDRESIRKAVRESLYIDHPPPPDRTTEGSSLTDLLDRTAMKKAAHAEAALLVIANALHQIDGPKAIILAGWGIGELQGRSGVRLKPEWYTAVGLLEHDHVPVIVLDTGLQAQLMVGLKATAAATGGMYTSQDFKNQALARVEGALAGHYALSLRIDDLLKPGQYPLDIRVNRKDTYVQAPTFVTNSVMNGS